MSKDDMHSHKIYVSPQGNDAATGAYDDPLVSIHEAVDRAREWKEARGLSHAAPVSIVLRGGTYYQTETIVLDERDHQLTIEALEGEKVVLSGGIDIPAASITQQGRIYQANLRELGITDYGAIRKVGFARPYGPSWGEVVVNGKPFQLARYPNRGMMRIEHVVDTGSQPRIGDYSNRGGTIGYSNPRISKWADEPEAWMGGYFMWGYADDMIPVAEIDTVAKTVRAAAATMYGFADGAAYRTWYGVNLASELDTVGEYYVDRQRGMLSFISDEQPQHIVFSQLESPFFNIENTNWLTIRGISFEHARGIGITTLNTERLLIEGCVFQHLGSVGVSMGLGVTPFIDFKEVTENVAAKGIVGNLPQHLYTNTVFNRHSGRNNTIKHCVFRHLGGGGVTLGGGDRITLAKGNNRVESSVFYDINRIERSYRPAVHLSGVGNVVANCEMFDIPGAAILMNGNDHILEYNYIHNVANEVNDLGAIYYGRDPSELGITVRYNLIADIPHQFLTAGIYHDDGACGMIAHSNILVNAGQRSVLLGGGSDNVYYNNLFIGTEAGIFIDERLTTWAKHLTIPDTGLYAMRLKAVDYTSSTYQLAYPRLAHYFSSLPHPVGNLVHRNVFVNFDDPIYAKGKTMLWRKKALGVSRENIITDDNDILTTIHEKGLPWAISRYDDVLDPIPVEKIGLQPSGYINTQASSWGISGAYATDATW